MTPDPKPVTKIDVARLKRDFNIWVAPAVLGGLVISVPALLAIFAIDTGAFVLENAGRLLRQYGTQRALDYLIGAAQKKK